MTHAASRYDGAKVGDDLLLSYQYVDTDGVAVDFSAGTITILNSADVATVDAAAVDVTTPSAPQYEWTPATAGNYRVEFCMTRDDDGRTKYSETIAIRVVDRLAT